MSDLKRKLSSRKFWMCVAAFLASVGASIAGLNQNNTVVSAIGIVCTIASTGIYAAGEAYVDAAREKTKASSDDIDS